MLIEALTWIRQFRGKITVIKLGGSVMEDQEAMTHLLLDVVFMETVGMRPVIVHGGGAAISRAMAEAGLRSQDSSKDDDTPTTPHCEIVERVLAGEVNERLAKQIDDLGGRGPEPLNFETTNVLFGERICLTDETADRLTWAHVGQVTRVDRGRDRGPLPCQGVVPVIPSMCVTDEGEKLNVNADTAATAVAQALGAEKLVYLSDVNGVRRDKDDPDSLIHSLTAEEAWQMIDSGTISAGMIPKVASLPGDARPRRAQGPHHRRPFATTRCCLEVYTEQGRGHEIVKD